MNENDQEFAEEVIKQINKLRKFPRSFIPFLQEHLECFDGNVLKRDGQNMLTEEGPKPVWCLQSLMPYSIMNL